MEAMRDSWTDDRLDDFAAHTEQRFDRLERQVDARFDRVENRLDKFDDQFARVNGRIDQLSQVMFRTITALIVTMALGFASLLVAGP
jgi:uncharacterized protein YdcH (DUF465 family)